MGDPWHSYMGVLAYSLIVLEVSLYQFLPMINVHSNHISPDSRDDEFYKIFVVLSNKPQKIK